MNSKIDLSKELLSVANMFNIYVNRQERKDYKGVKFIIENENGKWINR